MELCTLASGSSGNCTLVKTAQGSILIDAGISCRQITKALAACGCTLEALCGVLITHEHSDHIKGLQTMVKQHRIPIYTSAATGRQLTYRIAGIEGLLQPVAAGRRFHLAGLEILPFATPHDVPGSLGFTFTDGVRRAALATDMGYVTEAVAGAIVGADLVLLEANYEESMLLNGPYPPELKRRIRGDRGHLSNADCAEFACYLAENGTKRLILGHLSDKNNTPDRAWQVVRDALEGRGFHVGRDIALEIAPRYVSGPMYVI